MTDSRDPQPLHPKPPKQRWWQRRWPWRREAQPSEPPAGKRRRLPRLRLTRRGQPAAAAGTPSPKRVPWLRRKRYRVIIARTISWGLVGAICLIFAAYGAVRVFVKPAALSAWIVAQAEEQTGGRLDIGALQFDVLTGIRVADVRFYPPLPTDPRGFLHGGAVDLRPLADLQLLDVRYSFAKFIAARVNIKALQLVRPAIHLHQEDGVFNFAGILAYRAKRFPPEPAKTPPPDAAPTGAPDAGLLPVSPALLYLPFELLAQNVGIKDLSFDLIKVEKGKVTQVVATKGVSVDVGVHWLGRDSAMWFSLMSPFERPLELDVEDATSGTFRQTLAVRTALAMRLELANLQRISLDFATRIISLQTPAAGYRDLGTFVKARLSAASDFKGISFDTFEVELADALDYELGGSVSVTDASFQQINVKLKQKLTVDLKAAALLAKPFVPSLSADGEITVDDLKVEGVIEPSKLAQAASGVGLPFVSTVIWLEDVSVDYPETGVAMAPFSGSVSVAAGPALSGTGSQVDVAADVSLPKVTAKRVLPSSGEVEAGVENLAAKVTARVLWPEMIAPVLKVSVEADHVRASGTKIPTIDVPLFVDIDADGRKDLARLAFSANVELTDLAELSAMADCQAQCTRFRASALGRMASLERLHALALPLGAVLGAGPFMPTTLTGGVDFQVAARGRMLNPLTTPVPELLKTADVRFNAQMNLAKLSAKIPFMNIDLRNFDTRLIAEGTLPEQKVDLSQKFDALTLAVPQAEGKPPLAVAVNRFAFETSVTNTVDGPPVLGDPKALFAQLASEVTAKLFIGKVTADGALPRPISEFQLTLAVAQQHLADIQLTDLTVKLPDYGTTVGLTATTTVGTDFLPKRLAATLKTGVVHTGDEKLPGGIKTSGKIDVRLSVDTPDMKVAAIGGEASFDKFNVLVPAKDGKGPPLLVVQDIKGQIPFKQTIVLPDLSQLGKPAAVAATAVAVAQGPLAGSSETKAAKAPKDDVAVVPVVDDEDGAAGESQLDVQVDKYFAKNDDKLAQTANIVAMVDYGSIRPFYPERRPLAIGKVDVANLELSNMEFDLELRQNWFALNQFVINFLGGKIQGDFQLAFDAAAKDPRDIPRSLRLAVHMTRLDTRKLLERFPNLKGKATSWDLFSNPYIDGTIHLAYDLRSNDISGGVEITSIGKEQLKMMLYYVDPFEQNPTIGDIRKALAVGDVRQVSIPLKNGEVGMDVDVRLLSAPIPTPKLSRFPISQILQNFKDQAGGASPAKDAPPQPAPAVPATTAS